MKTIPQPDTYSFPLTKWMDELIKPTRNRFITVKGFSEEHPITVQTLEDGSVTHCDHAGAEFDVISYDVMVNGFDGPDMAEISHAGLACNKCPAWQSEDGEWHE